ncbi:DUF389 domain-containing protein [Lysobacter pythonis]|uniref:DUF389 domain-containing protein n=1 Tax=Solilutibacter pythonis TaxID=2483112 RepID=A0A3M2HXT4_9GAMM|nr:DUF389 domain-containing protein [Lysobacter pythonis]RMH93868.1 DUF389 domain-containing protein [Lysobacter pythonis]
MSTALHDLPSPRALWRWLRQWRKTHLVDSVDRVAVLTHVDEAGALGPRFAFMTLMSVGIAMLGLLQNSAAVIIGAMLIAPLMGPIIELGMGLATFDFRTVRSALKTIAVGVALALSMAMLIVWLSPLKQATAEILARTEPTFFDLLVAVFSGLAGAYATITRKGETIVGVAIATALMPPLAVVAYGLVLMNWSIAGGAAMLLMTNLLAIALSATIIARLYGFGAYDSPKQSAWQAGLIVGTFVLLSIPLGLSLQRIAQKTQAEVAIRNTLDAEAGKFGGRISALRVDNASGAMIVDAVLMTPRHVQGLETQLSQQLGQQLGRRIDVQLREVLTADEAGLARQQATLSELSQSIAALKQAEAGRDAARAAETEARHTVVEALAARFGTLEQTAGNPQMTLRLSPRLGLSLAEARALETQLAASLDETRANIRVVPPLQALPPVPWRLDDEGRLDTAARQMLAAQIWALQRWQVTAIDSIGFARAEETARERAAEVAMLIRGEGIPVQTSRAANAGDRRAADDVENAVWLRLPPG